MSDRDRKLVWTVGVVTLLAGGFLIGRLFGGDRGLRQKRGLWIGWAGGKGRQLWEDA